MKSNAKIKRSYVPRKYLSFWSNLFSNAADNIRGARAVFKIIDSIQIQNSLHATS